MKYCLHFNIGIKFWLLKFPELEVLKVRPCHRWKFSDTVSLSLSIYKSNLSLPCAKYILFLHTIKPHQSPRYSFKCLTSMDIRLTCLCFKSQNSVYNKNIPVRSIRMKQNCFFHVAFDHINYFRKMPTNSHPVLTVEHIHKDSPGLWDKVISQK